MECALETPELGADILGEYTDARFELIDANPPPPSKKPPPPAKKLPPLPPKKKPPPPRPATPAT